MKHPIVTRDKFPLSWKTRNLVKFCRRPDYEVHKSCFIANYAFRDAGSRFSVLKNHGSLPGPDECFSLKFGNAYPLFKKLLGMKVFYPNMTNGQVNEQTFYSSASHYRSHIEEVFYCNSTRPLPPVEGYCTIFFPERDVIRITYELLNKSAATVTVNLCWYSLPDPGVSRYGAVEKHGFIFRNVQREVEIYEAWALLSCSDKKVVFCWDGRRFTSDLMMKEILPNGSITVEFEIFFGFGDIREKLKRPLFSRVNGKTVSGAVRRLEGIYNSLPHVSDDFREFEKLALNAAGTLNSLKCYEDMPDGRRINTIHPGKGALAHTYFWDGAFTLPALDLLGEYDTALGLTGILIGGINASGVPSSYFGNGKYSRGYQQPILSLGISQLKPACLPGKILKRWYPVLSRYVRSWIKNGGRLGEHLGWDDALRWQDRFPIASGRTRSWGDEDWGVSVPSKFEKPDTHAYLYMECLALARMAERLGLNGEASDWKRRSEILRDHINENLFNEKDGFYQDRRIDDGNFNGMNTAAGFLPLYAGVVPHERGARICREFLLDRSRFHSPMPFATLDMRHPAFRSGGGLKSIPGHPEWYIQQSYWIGRTWPHVSFWLLGALCRYGFRKEAEDAAYGILDAMSRSDAIFECYDSLTGYGNGQPEFMWSSAAALLILCRRYACDMPDAGKGE